MKPRAFCYAIICIFFALIQVGAQQPASASGPVLVSTPASPASAISVTATKSVDSPEVTLLRAQLSASEKYNDRILQTVQWAIGLSLTLFTLLFGVSWFSSYKINKNIQMAMIGRIDKAMTGREERLQKTMSAKITDLQKQVGSIIDPKIARLASQLEATSKSINARLDRVEYDIADREAAEWEEAGVFANALRGRVAQLKIAQQERNPFHVESALDSLLKLLNSQAKYRLTECDASLAEDIFQAMREIPESHKLTTNIILSHVEALRRK